MSNPRILITGASGFVGTQITKLLISQQKDLVLVTRRKDAFQEIESKGIITIVQSDNIFSENKNWWKKHLIDIDIVIHLAWYVEPNKYLNSEKNIECLSGSLTLAKAATEMDIKKFVGIGTCFEYDLNYGLLQLDTPLKADSLYSSAKISTYLMLSELFKDFAISFLWCRLFYLFGEGEHKSRLIPYIHEKIKSGDPVELTSGNQIRDYMDVREAAELILSYTFSEYSGAANICSGKPTSVRQIAETIADKYNRRDLLKFGIRKDNNIDPPFITGKR